MAPALTIEPEVDNVRLDLTIPAGANRLTISRTGPSGTPAGVRGWQSTPVGPGALVARDFEAPIGVPLTYTTDTWTDPGGAHTLQTATITIPSQGCSDTWLTDLVRAGNTQRVTLEHLDELAYAVPTGVHSIIGRRDPIVSGDVAHTPTFELSFLTDTDDDREQARGALGNGVPVLLRTPPEDGIGNLYLAVTGFSEQRIVPAATEPARRFVVAAVQVERPDPTLYVPLAPATYANVKATFASYTALNTGRASYDAVAYDWAGSAPSDIVPWPPADV